MLSHPSCRSPPLYQLEYVTVLFTLHAVESRAGWKLPASQLLHSPLPVTLAKLPGLHALHACDDRAPDLGLDVPGEQRRHAPSCEDPASSLKVPGRHSSRLRREAAPGSGQYPPGQWYGMYVTWQHEEGQQYLTA